MRRQKQVLIENVLIVDTGHKGYAVGKTPEGATVFVQHVVPGDRVNALTTKKRKGTVFCKAEEILEYSPYRTEPQCQHFGMCGGCKWQHMQYSAQLQFKERSVTESLKRIAHIPEPPVEPIMGCENPFYYRNKMEFTFTDRRWLTAEEHLKSEATDRPGLGLHVAGAFAHVANLEECLLQNEPANAIRNFVRDFALECGWSFQNVRHHNGLLRNLIIRNNPQGQFMVTVVFGEDDPAVREMLFPVLLREFDCITSLFYCINTKLNDAVSDQDFIHVSGDPFLRMQLGHIEYCLGPKSFFQTNSTQAEVMCNVVRDMAGLTPEMLVYDLYCGIGSFSLFLAKQVRQVIGIEYIPEAIDDAISNASHNQITNAAFFAGDVRTLIGHEVITEHGTPDVIITDPPRAGMDAKVVEAMLAIGAPRIVYISCNPATQARDLELLAARYDVIKCQPIDMFPQTAHVENVALLERRD
jgi:23S rRNA (uracil1939-C5)-methyltransferase